jgi:hypothetical protein
MLIGALNFNNNPALLLTLLVTATTMISFHHTVGQLNKVELLGVSADPVHAGQALRLRFAMRADASVDRPELVLDQDTRITRFALPAGTQAIAVLQVRDPADRRTLQSTADLQLNWVDDTDALIAAIRALPLPAGEGYAWCAGEAAAMATLRRVLVDEKGHDRHAIRAAAYWKRGATAHHENLN